MQRYCNRCRGNATLGLPLVVGSSPEDKHLTAFNPETFLTKVGNGKTTLTCPRKQVLFSQGDAADAVFYIQTGKVRLSVASSQGQEAIIASYC